MKLVAFLLGLGLCVPGFSLAARAETAAGDFLAGYATAVVEREFDLIATITVEAGTLHIEAPQFEDVDREPVERALLDLEGVREVEWIPTPRAGDEGERAAPADSGGGSGAGREFLFLPEVRLFAPLLADPRWPHFSASYQRYIGDDELSDVGSATFGESFALFETDAPFEGRFQFGIQTGVFSIFDFDSESFDLVNSDFLAGATATWARGDLAVLARFFHQSSHLGDEFLLRNPVQRINLSFEAFDLLLSYDVNEWLRVYGGGGYLVRADPSDLDRGVLQFGGELTSSRTYLDGFARPLAALDIQLRGETDWEPDLSLRIGVQFESPRLRKRRLLLMFEYYDGRSPNGQFFERNIRYVGVGPHLFF